MSSSQSSQKELNIQEAIRLVQECNYSRRKAASCTGISPNTLKRRLNGSIPRELYLERTKKITAGEEMVLENMIVALIQQNEHIKATSLRAIVALYLQHKSSPTKLEDSPPSSADLELIPKGWCTRFMKRSKNLSVTNGYVQIKSESQQAESEEKQEPLKFFDFMKPPHGDNESIDETVTEMVRCSNFLTQGYRNDLGALFQKSRKELDSNNVDAVRETLGGMETIFDHLMAMNTVLTFTSQVSENQLRSKTRHTNTTNSITSNSHKRSDSAVSPRTSHSGIALPQTTYPVAQNSQYPTSTQLTGQAPIMMNMSVPITQQPYPSPSSISHTVPSPIMECIPSTMISPATSSQNSSDGLHITSNSNTPRSHSSKTKNFNEFSRRNSTNSLTHTNSTSASPSSPLTPNFVNYSSNDDVSGMKRSLSMAESKEISRESKRSKNVDTRSFSWSAAYNSTIPQGDYVHTSSVAPSSTQILSSVPDVSQPGSLSLSMNVEQLPVDIYNSINTTNAELESLMLSSSNGSTFDASLGASALDTSMNAINEAEPSMVFDSNFSSEYIITTPNPGASSGGFY